MNYVVIGDHRTVYIDIDVREILKGHNHNIDELPTRKLRISNEKAATCYMQLLIKYFHQHRIQEKVKNIPRNLFIASQLEDSNLREIEIKRLAEELNKLDEFRISLMHTAEHKCIQKMLTKTYLWSTSLITAGQTITFWEAMKKSLQLSVPIYQV